MKKLALFLVVTSLAASAYAQGPAAPATPGTTAATPSAAPAKPLGMADKKLIKDLSELILIEQAYLKVITDVKPTLAEALERDVKKADSDLKRLWTALANIATTKKADMATEVSKSDLAKVQKLGKEKPEKFQKEFFKDLGKETSKSVKLVDGAKQIQDPEVKIFFEDWGATIKSIDRLAETGAKSASAKK